LIGFLRLHSDKASQNEPISWLQAFGPLVIVLLLGWLAGHVWRPIELTEVICGNALNRPVIVSFEGGAGLELKPRAHTTVSVRHVAATVWGSATDAVTGREIERLALDLAAPRPWALD